MKVFSRYSSVRRCGVCLDYSSDGVFNEGEVENLFSADLAYLQEFYRKVNEDGTASLPAVCPECKHEFVVDFSMGAA